MLHWKPDIAIFQGAFLSPTPPLRQKVAQAGKYELKFLIGRLIMGGALVAAVTWLTLNGKLASETTIMTLMATLGLIMRGKGQN
jgi:hypothetical protein